MFHEELKAARRRRKMSRKELARRSGVPRSSIDVFEAGGNVHTRTIEKLLAVLPEAGRPTLTGSQVPIPTAQIRALLDTIMAVVGDGLRLVQSCSGEEKKEG